MKNKKFNKKYYLKDKLTGVYKVNVKKITREVDSIYELMVDVLGGLDCIKDGGLLNKLTDVQIKLIDLGEDLKGNYKERKTS